MGIRDRLSYVNTVVAENMFLLSADRLPVTLIETIDFIRELRKVADDEWEVHGNYDPQGHTERICDAFRDKADHLEQAMESRIGWSGIWNG